MLSEEQNLIIHHDFNRNILALACAGAGKTHTMISRIEHIIHSKICSPDEILVTTFTQNATKNIKSKLNIDNIHTIDSFSYKIISENNLLNSKIIDLYNPDMFKLILFYNKDILLRYHFKYIFIDEVQDIDDIQYNIFNQMQDNGAYLYMTGDEKQNIFNFRGSTNKYIMHPQEYFNDIDVFYLTYNYRSSLDIVRYTNNIEKKLKSKIITNTLKTSYEFPIQIVKVNSKNGYAKQIDRIINEYKLKYDECTVICRTRDILYTNETFFLDRKKNLKFDTIHGYKGLENDNIFFIGVSENIIPHMRANLSEELRLLYVGLTRARKKLFIMYHNKPSEFIDGNFNISCEKLECNESIFPVIEKQYLILSSVSNRYNISSTQYHNEIESDEIIVMTYLYMIRSITTELPKLVQDFISRIEFDNQQFLKYNVEKSPYCDIYDFFIKKKTYIINNALIKWTTNDLYVDDILNEIYVLSCCIVYLLKKKKAVGFFNTFQFNKPDINIFKGFRYEHNKAYDLINETSYMKFILFDNMIEYIDNIKNKKIYLFDVPKGKLIRFVKC